MLLTRILGAAGLEPALTGQRRTRAMPRHSQQIWLAQAYSFCLLRWMFAKWGYTV
jgi:hypothetical protein